MKERAFQVLMAFMLGALAAAIPQEAAQADCATGPDVVESGVLEIVEKTVAGEKVTDLSEYRSFDWRLRAKQTNSPKLRITQQKKDGGDSVMVLDFERGAFE